MVRSSALRNRVLSLAKTISMGEERKENSPVDCFQRRKGPGCMAAGREGARLRRG